MRMREWMRADRSKQPYKKNNSGNWTAYITVGRITVLCHFPKKTMSFIICKNDRHLVTLIM